MDGGDSLQDSVNVQNATKLDTLVKMVNFICILPQLKNKNINVQIMNKHNLCSFKHLSPDKEARRRHIWHCVLD